MHPWVPRSTDGNAGHSELSVFVVLYVRHVTQWLLV